MAYDVQKQKDNARPPSADIPRYPNSMLPNTPMAPSKAM